MRRRLLLLCWLVLVATSTTKTTSGFSARNFHLTTARQGATITRNFSNGIISFAASNVKNDINHHHHHHHDDEEGCTTTLVDVVSPEVPNQHVYTEDDSWSPSFSVLATMTLIAAASSMTFMPALPAAAAAAASTTTTLNIAAAAALPSALWAYGHYVSIIAIFGCLAVERTLVKVDMSVQDENTVVKLDVVYGVMAALLYVCLSCSLCSAESLCLSMKNCRY
jgi:Predicted membrane protein (DUF2214)